MVYKHMSFLKFKLEKLNLLKKRIVKKYLKVLRKLEYASLKLDDADMHKFNKEHLLTSRIALEIYNLFSDGVDNDNKASLNESIKIMREETRRLSSIRTNIRLKRKLNLTYTRKSAKELLLRYISEDNISNELLNSFSDGNEELTRCNEVLKEGIKLKSKPGKADVLPRNEIKAEIKKYDRIRIMALLSGALVLYNITPTLKYSLAKHNITQKNEIVMAINKENNKTEYVKQLFADNINKNKNLTDDEKELLINSFNEYFLNDHAHELSEDNIINMCMVAKTEDIKKISYFTKTFSWWSGSYNPLTNRFSYASENKEVAAHEQLHAILKNGTSGTGFTNYLIGYAINEGMTANNIGNGYHTERLLTSAIGTIIGNDKLSECFYNHDLKALTTELCKYSSKKEVLELLLLSDFEIFRSYFFTFKSKFIDEAKKLNLIDNYEDSCYLLNEKYCDEDYYERQEKIKLILINMYEKKNGGKMEDDSFGNFLKYSNYFCNSKVQNIDTLNYDVFFEDSNHTKILFWIFDGEKYHSCEFIFEDTEIKNLDFNELTKNAMDEINNLEVTKVSK